MRALPPGSLTALANRPWVRGLLALHRLLYRLSAGRVGLYVYVLCAQPLQRAGAAAPQGATRIVEVRRHDDALLANFPRAPDVLAQRFAAGSVCYAALVRDRFAGCIWVAEDHFDEDEVRCRYQLHPPGLCVWDYDVYVEPALRLTRVLSRMWAHVSADLFERGKRWSISRISLYSRRSIQSHEKLGAQKVGLVGFLVLGRRQLSWQTGSRRVHLSRGTDDRPLVRVAAPSAEAPACH
jgi:hypothetical protein